MTYNHLDGNISRGAGWMLKAALLGLCALSATAQTTRPPTRPTAPGVQPGRPAQPVRPVRPPGVRPGAQPAPTAGAAAPTPTTAPDASPNSLNYQDAEAGVVLQDYAARTERTLLLPPNLPNPTITLRSQPNSNLSEEDWLTAIEQILNLNGIALEPVGEKFLRVLPSAELRKFAPKTVFPPEDVDPAEDRYPERGQFISRMVEMKNIDINEAKTVIDGFVRSGAQIQTFERSNSVLVTDSADNVNRILEVLNYIDRPLPPAREETKIIQIHFAKAADIKTRLMEIVTEAQANAAGATSAAAERQAGAPGTVRRQLPQGVTLPRTVARPGMPGVPATEALEALIQDAERGVIRGKVQIISDERTNILIIITRPENMVFFERLVEALDREMSPDVVVETIRLEHALATDVASLLNDLIGNESRDTAAPPGAAPAGQPAGERSQSLTEFNRRRQADSGQAGGESKSKVGQLDKDNIKILADERSNALVIMASNSDMATIKELIQQVDIMLSQVIIETVFIELTFEDTMETGVDWVQRAMRTVSGGKAQLVWAGQGGGGSMKPADPMGMTATVPGSEGISYYLTAVGLNLDVVLRAVATDSRARIMSSPVIMTQDNKEAVLEATERRYFFKGKRYAGTVGGDIAYEDDVEQQDVGLTLKVTPRINKKGYVVLTIEQTVDALGADQQIGNAKWPTVTSRKMGSDVAVNSGETVVLGGLAKNSVNEVKSKIPLLGDIPFLGWFFRSTRVENTRNEIVVFLTPRVIDGPIAAEDEARNRKAYLDTGGVWRSDWSSSRLADPISEKDRRKLLDRAGNTLSPPSYPLTRELAPLNEELGLVAPEAEDAAPATRAAPTAPDGWLWLQHENQRPLAGEAPAAPAGELP